MEISEKERFVCGFHEREIAVNSPGSLAALRRRDRLHLYITTQHGRPVELARSRTEPLIEVRASVGEGGNHLFTPDDTGGYGVITSEGFTVKEGWTPSKKSKSIITCKLIPNESGSAQLWENGSVSLCWDDICSTACEGVCSVRVKLSGFPGIEDDVYECRLFKVRAQLRINYFTAQPSCGMYGQKVLLKWRVENATGGHVLPGGHNIFQSGIQSTSTQEITLDGETERYYLNIFDEDNGAYRFVHVYTVPPKIAVLSANKQSVQWETHFAARVEFAQDGPPRAYCTVLESSQRLSGSPKTVSLRCTGHRQCVTRHLLLPRHPEICFFQMTEERFENHRVVKVEWETQQLRTVEVVLWDTRNYVVSTEKKGSWEQAYTLEQVSAGIRYTLADGTSAMEVIDSD